MFHNREGLYFEQLPFGDVRLLKRESAIPDSPIVLDMVIDKDSWASIIASMSYYGEIDNGYYRALNFHTGEVVDPVTCPLVEKTPLPKREQVKP